MYKYKGARSEEELKNFADSGYKTEIGEEIPLTGGKLLNNFKTLIF